MSIQSPSMSTPVSGSKNILNSLLQYSVIFECICRREINLVSYAYGLKWHDGGTLNDTYEIRICSHSWPNHSFVNRASTIFQENVILDTSVESWVVCICHGGIYHHDVMLVVRMEVVHNLSNTPKWVVSFVQRENPSCTHIILCNSKWLVFLGFG